MIKTAESVTIGHPDKVCDQIADAILDACLEQDPKTRSAVEVLGGHRLIVISGELTTQAKINPQKIARAVYTDCGYSEDIAVITNINEQSSEIGAGVDNEGAGDQGIMIGYATQETKELMPLEVILSRRLSRAIGSRDGKAQVTTKDGKVTSFITSVCGELTEKENDKFERDVKTIIDPHLKENLSLEGAWLKNPNGKWTIGGFTADAGLTGRKIVIDSYGPNIPVGGGAFSGKDATKVDRSGAYMARRIAVDYLKKYGAKEVFVHLAYAIGKIEPLMATAVIDGKEKTISDYDLRPRAIIEFLQLEKPRFRETAKYGHFGNGFKWDN